MEKETAMDMIQKMIDSMEKSGMPDAAVRATADTLLDLLNLREWDGIIGDKRPRL